MAHEIRIRGCGKSGRTGGSQEEVTGTTGGSGGNYRISQSKGYRSRKDETETVDGSGGPTNRSGPCNCDCQCCREETEGIRQDYRRMETQSGRSCRGTGCQSKGMPQLQHRTVQAQRYFYYHSSKFSQRSICLRNVNIINAFE